MGEIMRWRVTRLAQRRIPRPETVLSLKGPLLLREPLLNGGEAALAQVRGEYRSVLVNGAALRRYLSTGRGGAQTPQNPTLTAAVSNVFVNLLVLDEWLAAATPLPPAIPPFTTPAVADLQNEIDTLNLTQEPHWADLWQLLADLYYLALLFSAAGDGFALIETLGLLTRWLLVMGLVDAIKGIKDATGTVPSPVNTPDDVYAALRWRTPLLPDAVTAALLLIRDQRRAVVVRKPGFADLYITREEWDHYEAAEIASIENILAGELKSRVHELVNQTTVTTTTDVTTSTLKEQDTTTTDLSQLQQQSSSDISLAAHIDGQVDTVGQYGPTQVSTHLGGSLDFSSATATSRATTQSHETVARSVSKIEQTTRLVRTVSTLTKATDKEQHTFDATQAKKAIVGIYRWVDQIQDVELDRYPHRFLLEFELPEPGAWTRWLLTKDAGQNMINRLPAPLTLDGKPVTDTNPPLRAADLTTSDPTAKAYYGTVAARYGTTGISPPPGPLTVAVNLSAVKDNNEPPRFDVMNAAETTFSPPSGYQIAVPAAGSTNWTASLLYTTGGFVDSFTDVHIDVAVGGGAPARSGTGAFPADHAQSSPGNVFRDQITGTAGPISQGMIPVSLQGTNLTGFEVNVEVLCEPIAATFQQWQSNTYDSIVSAYNTMLQAYNQEKSGLSFQQANPIDANSPDQNASTITQELKRQTIEMLLGNQFLGLPAITWDDTGANAPFTNLTTAGAVAPEVQFFEQVFEWETMSYICYPYYWADSTRWQDLAALVGTDANFADFLRAGSARVVIAARPGFEDQVNLYVYTGVPWGAGPLPAPGDPDYLSVADEIKAQQQRPSDVTVIDTWQVRLPTTLIWLENDSGLPKNPSPTIDISPRITGLSEIAGAVGDPVRIDGRNFGDIQGMSAVAFNGTAATPTGWSAHAVDVTVPAGATSGPVVVTASGVPSNGVDFKVN
jgi:hypothetical protein